MNTIDLIVYVVLALAVWTGWKQGFIVQICSLAALVGGIWLAFRFGATVGVWLRLDEEVSAAGGFVVVLLATVIVVGILARLARNLFRSIGFGVWDTVLGIAVAGIKYLLLLGALFSAFERLNADYTILKPQQIEQSKLYKPVMHLSDMAFPFLERLGERVQQEKQ